MTMISETRNVRLKDICSYTKGFAFKITDFVEDGIPLIKASDIKQFTIQKPSFFIPPKRIKEFKQVILFKNDIIISSVGSQPNVVESAVGQLALIDDFTAGSLLNQNTVILRFNKKHSNSKFMLYYFISTSFRKHLNFIARGTANQSSIKVTETLSFETILPQLEVQNAITKYLDSKVFAIDKKIYLLTKKNINYKELRTCIIKETISKGLDKKVVLKESGIDWIGKIPKHWEIKRLKDVCNIYNGATPESHIKEYWDGGINWITPAEFCKEKFIYNSKRTITQKGLKSCATRLVPVGTIIISCRAPIGSLVIAGSKLSTNQGCKSLFANKINNLFLFYYLSVNNQILSALGNGTTFNELSTTNLVNLFVIFPSKEEQTSIANYLDEKTDTIDKILSNISNQIETLKELRKTLINDVVTGKTKVIKE